MKKINKIILYGQGNGRDHANHIALMKSNNIEFCSLIRNENALMEQYKNVYYIKSIEDAIRFANDYHPDLIIISNRADLNDGATERFRECGFEVFGITKEVARLETVKEYAKKFMMRNNINTPDYFVADNEDNAIKFVKSNWNKTKYGYVLKVDQFSKNSFERTSVPESLENAIQEINRLFNSTPNAKLIIEERIIGYELSLHILINNGKYTILPLVQDYKKKYPNNEGPMTAGTASVASGKEIPCELLEMLKKYTIEPTITALKKENIEYNYILYIGVMISNDGKPYILEYNTRTGNPEWLALLGLLDKSFAELIEAFYNNIDEISNFWKKDSYSIAMYGFSAGYPEVERKYFNEKIMNLNKISCDTDIIGEHIVKQNNNLVPSGGRVFALRRVGNNFDNVKKEIIQEFYKIKMNGLYFRDDIKQINLT
nr:hypothetical protein [Clostridia bacterium]